MRYLVTTCCHDKNPSPAPLPAVHRYRSPRIDLAARQAMRHGHPLLILSGKLGLVTAEEPIPFYDLALVDTTVAALVPRLVQQLRRHRATRLAFLARPPSTPGWSPYHRALHLAAGASGVTMAWICIGDGFPE